MDLEQRIAQLSPAKLALLERKLRLGVRIETVEKILNHASGSFRGIVGVYQKYDFASEKREALTKRAQHVVALEPRLDALSKAA
jgi:hypothetical protein